MDIKASVSIGHHEDRASRGSLGWEDADGNRYHIWVVADANGRWVIETTTLRPDGVLYKNPPRSQDRGRAYRTKHLDPTAKAHAAKVRYVLEQQNAHGLIEAEVAGILHRRAQAGAEAVAKEIATMRGALAAFTKELVAEGAPSAHLDAMGELMRLPDASMIVLSRAIAQAFNP